MAELLRSALLGSVPHGFSTRDGARAKDVVPGGTGVRLKQIHSPEAVTVSEAFAVGAEPEGDALVTDRPGLVLEIVTADCAPVLLADRDAKIVGAAHAGWRGAHDGVVANTVGAMEALGARRDRIVAAIGPCIAQESYEVDAGFHDRFEALDARFFEPGRPGHWQFDLPAYVAAQLERAGVAAVDRLAVDTFAEEDRFFSYRRATHRGEPTGGRQVSLIGLPESA